MADEETQTNVVQFPRKYVGVAPKVTNFDAMKLNKELQFADELTDGIMVSMTVSYTHLTLPTITGV